jgi:hypothetical protein
LCEFLFCFSVNEVNHGGGGANKPLLHAAFAVHIRVIAQRHTPRCASGGAI